jgi:Holliday junction resolvase RusA-like endonuclease
MWTAIAGLVRRWAFAEFVVPGDPVAWERAGQNRQKGVPGYTPAKTRAGKAAVAEAFRAVQPDWVVDRERAFGLYTELHVGTLARTDVDNMVKLVMDALNQVVWDDDRQVADVLARIERGVADPHTLVMLYPAPENRHRRARTRRRRVVSDSSADVQRRAFNVIAVEVAAGRHPSFEQLAAAVGLGSATDAGDVVGALEAGGYLSCSTARPVKYTIRKPFRREVS